MYLYLYFPGSLLFDNRMNLKNNELYKYLLIINDHIQKRRNRERKIEFNVVVRY